MMATWPGRDSVGTRVWETPKVPSSNILDRRKGASDRGTRSLSELGYGSGCSWNALSARNPSPWQMGLEGQHSNHPGDAKEETLTRTYRRRGPDDLRERESRPACPPGTGACPTQSGWQSRYRRWNIYTQNGKWRQSPWSGSAWTKPWRLGRSGRRDTKDRMRRRLRFRGFDSTGPTCYLEGERRRLFGGTRT